MKPRIHRFLSLLALLCAYSVSSVQAQLGYQPVQVRSTETGKILYEAVGLRDLASYPLSTSGLAAYTAAATAGQLSLSLTCPNGTTAVIAAGSVPPAISPCESQTVAVPSWLSGLRWRHDGTTLTFEGAGQIGTMRFERQGNQPISTTNPDGVPINSSTFYPYGSISTGTNFTRQWQLNLPPVPMRVTLKQEVGTATHTFVFVPEVTGSDWRYLNGTITNNPNNPPPNTPYLTFERVVFQGNSITAHPSTGLGSDGNKGFNIGEGNVWGMAATTRENDYVHKLVGKMRQVSPFVQFLASGTGSVWEQQYQSGFNYAQITSEVNNAFGGQSPDWVFIYISENVDAGNFNEAAFRSGLDQLVAAHNPNANTKVVFRNSFWNGKDVVNAVLYDYATQKGYYFVDLSPIREGSAYMAYGDWSLASEGVKRHPGNAGMQWIADKSWEVIGNTSTPGTPGSPGQPASPVTDAEFDAFAAMADTPWDAYDTRQFGNGAAGTNGRREHVPVGNKYILDNGTVHAEVWELFGGAVAHLSMGSGRDNMFNLYDLGRGTYMSLYGWPQPMNPPYKNNMWKAGGPWAGMSHNPIQGGDSFDYPCTMLKHVKSGNKTYTKVIMQQWAWHNQPTDVILEQITSLAANNAVEVKVRWTQNRTDEYKDVRGPAAQQQEYPCFMVNGRNRRVAYAVGSDQFGSSQDIRVLVPVEGNGQSWEGTPYYISEPWHAVEFKANQWVGLVADGFYRTSQNTVIISGDGGMCEFCNEMTYLADHRQMHLDPNVSKKHKFYLVTGSNYTDIRNFAATLPRETKPDWHFTQANGRCGWHSKACHDEREPFPSDNWKLTTARELQSDQTNAGVSKLFSPPIGYKTSDFNTVYIRYKYQGPQNSLRLGWILNGQKDAPLQSWTPNQENNRFPRGERGGNNQRNFQVIADGQWHTVAVNLSGSDWNGIVQEFQIEGFGGTPENPDRIELSYIGATNPGN